MKDLKYCLLLLLTNLCLVFCILRLSVLIQWTSDGVGLIKSSMQEFSMTDEKNMYALMETENQLATLTLEEYSEMAETAASGQRVIYYTAISDTYLLTSKEYETLLSIVEAEAGGEDYEGKLLVANVILNRVASDKFPDNVVDVVYQKSNGISQFQPVSNGTIGTVKISEETKKAVKAALTGEDYSDGALYFAARKIADPERMKWFDEHLTFLFSYGGHEFFR